MIKQFSRFEIAALKRSLKNIRPLYRKREALMKKVEALNAEIQEVDAKIFAYKQMMDPITGGIDPELIIAQDGHVEITEHPEIAEDNTVDLAPVEEAPMPTDMYAPAAPTE